MLRTVLAVAVSYCVFGSVQASVVFEHGSHQTTATIKVDGIESEEVIVSYMPFTKVTLKGIDGYDAILPQFGMPALPVVRFFVMGEGDIAVSNGDATELPLLSEYVIPMQDSLDKSSMVPAPFMMNMAIYASSDRMPGKLYDVEEAGRVRGERRRLVTLYPYQYVPLTGENEFYSEMTVTMPLQEQHRDTRSGAPTILFVAGSEFNGSPALEKYVAHKEAVGFQVAQVFVEDEGPEQIRKWIQGYYNSTDHDLRFVLIVGDNEQVPGAPARYLHRAEYVTDHFYRSLDMEDYDADVSAPDVELGRLSVSSEKELEVVVNKNIRYVSGRFRDPSWVSKASFVGTDDRYHVQLVEDTHDDMRDTWLADLYVGSYPEEGIAGGDRLYAIDTAAHTIDLVAAFDEGRALINYSGHGSTNRWAGPQFEGSDLDQLANTDALPFVISNACLTGKFQTDSFAEAWQRHPKGSIFFWGAVDLSYWDEDDVLQRAMYERIYGKGQRRFGQIIQGSLDDLWRHYGGLNRSKYYWESYSSFGDPSLEFRIREPRYAKIRHRWPNIPAGRRSFSLQVLDAGDNIAAGAQVAVKGPNGKALTATAGSDGHVRFEFDRVLRSGQVVEMTITGADLKQTTYRLRVSG